MRIPFKFLSATLLSLICAGCAASPRVDALRPEAPADVLPEAKSVFTLQFSNFTPGSMDDEPPLPPTVFVKIIKDDPAVGRVEWSKIHKEGTKLGWSREDDGVTPIHDVVSRKKGKLVRVDFDTKATLSKLNVDKIVPYESRHCPIMNRAIVKCPGPTVVKSAYKVNEAILMSDSGMTESIERLSGPGPVLDTVCQAHGGKGEPPKWSEEDLRLTRTQEAESLFGRAEDGWLSKNPKVRIQSRDAYRRLLREFPSESFVSGNLVRIKARAEAEIED